MDIKLEQVDYSQKLVLRHLIELYRYDFSEFTDSDVNELGLYDYKYLDNYWTEPNRIPFFIKVDGKYAGFALIRKTTGNPSSYSIAEFFVMKKYRKRGVGRVASVHLFKKYKGEWEITVLKENTPAKMFWKKVISDHLNVNYEEMKNDQGNITFSFELSN